MEESVPEPAGESDLYQVDPSQFTANRNALAKRMRAEGRRDEADRIGKLRRPPVTAWALNQVARGRPELIAAMLDAGRRSRSAMEKAVGGDASALRDTQGGQRRAVDAVVAAAVERLHAAGHPSGDTARQRMTETLGASVVDDEIALRLRDGLLDGDRSAPGFGLDGMSLPAPRVGAALQSKPEAPAAGRRGSDGKNRRRAEQKPEKEQAPEPDARTRRAALAAERERRRQARARHAELQAEARRLATRAERLQARAEDAERRAAEARATAEAARDETDQARRQADDARPDPEDEPAG